MCCLMMNVMSAGRSGDEAGQMLQDAHTHFHKAADAIGLSDRLRTILLTPFRTVKVDLVIENDDQELESL